MDLKNAEEMAGLTVGFETKADLQWVLAALIWFTRNITYPAGFALITESGAM